jgi:uncharacterized metal-binding protein
MASGKQHFIADMVICGVTLPLIYYYPQHMYEIIAANVLGTLFTPDIDDSSSTYSEFLVAKIVTKGLTIAGRRKSSANRDTKIIYRLQSALTAPYGVLISHRSWLSHAPLISTLTITFYLWLFYVVICKVFDYPSYEYLYFLQTYQIGFAIITLHHLIHTTMDGFMLIFFGRKVYLLGYPFYFLTTKLFPQGIKR